MILKILLLILAYFVFKNFFKAMRIIKNHEANQKQQNSPKTKQKNRETDIIDAEFTVLKD